MKKGKSLLSGLCPAEYQFVAITRSAHVASDTPLLATWLEGRNSVTSLDLNRPNYDKMARE